jgi:hypothetical protein
MLNWLNRKRPSTTASATAHPAPSLANWHNREKSGLNRNTPPIPERPPHRVRKLKALEVFSLVAVISLIIGVDIYIFGINKRLNALENEFAEVKTWAFPASLLEGKYNSLNARVRALTQAFSGLDSKVSSLAVRQQPDIVEASADTAVLAATETEIPSEAPAAGIVRSSAGIVPETTETTGQVERSTETAGKVERADEEIPAPVLAQVESQPELTPGRSAGDARLSLHSVEERPIGTSADETAIPDTPTATIDANPLQANPGEGRWVINLLSDPDKALADRFADRARQGGVPVEQNRSEVKGRVFWRVQITGFETAGEARAHADEVKAKLRLKDVWIFKQQG